MEHFEYVEDCDDLQTYNQFDRSNLSAYDCERDEEAQNLRKSGSHDMKFLKKDGFFRGNGFNSKLHDAVWGDCLEAWEKSMEYEYPSEEPVPHGFVNYKLSFNNTPGGRRLTASQFIDIYSAVAFANSQGYVLNAHITITWGLLDINDDNQAAAILLHNLLKPLKDWYSNNNRGQKLVWIYVHECGRKHGFHTHLLITLPISLHEAFDKWLDLRFKTIYRGFQLPENTYNITARPDDKIFRQWKYFQYLTKGIYEEEEIMASVGQRSHLRVRDLNWFCIENPGDVKCKKKYGISNLIGKKARQTAGFLSLLDQGVTDVRRIYAGMEYLRYLRQTCLVLDEGDPLVVKLLKEEGCVHKIVEQETLNQKENARLRKQYRKARKERRLEEEADALALAEYEARLKEESQPDLSSLNF